jgi:hypothetical protein
MAQYIDKSALLAEIEKLNIPFYPTLAEKMSYQDATKDCIDIIYTLKVKEVDLDAEWKRYFEHRGEMATVNVKHLAKYFFELGIEKSVNESIIRKIVDLNDEAAKHYDAVIKKENEENGFSQLAIDLFERNVDAKELCIQYIIENLKAQKGE